MIPQRGTKQATRDAALACLTLVIAFFGASCAEVFSPPLRLIREFYAATDASNSEKALSFFDPRAVVTTWAEGVNGRHWEEQSFAGIQQIRPLLTNRGFRLSPIDPTSPRYAVSETKVAGDHITFMLRPDRVSPSGRPYDPYRVTATLAGNKITSMEVVEYLAWE